MSGNYVEENNTNKRKNNRYGLSNAAPFIVFYIVSMVVVMRAMFSIVNSPTINVDDIKMKQEALSVLSEKTKWSIVSLQYDNNDNIYICIEVNQPREEKGYYVIKLDYSGMEVARFFFPQNSSTLFYVEQRTGYMLFVRTRATDNGIFIYNEEGKLTEKRKISEFEKYTGASLNDIYINANEIVLSNGSVVKIVRDDGDSRVVITDYSGVSKLVVNIQGPERDVCPVQ